MTESDPAALLGLAERLAREAAALLAGGRAHAHTGVGTKSTNTDMVTEMDRASERLIVEGLRAARPDDTIVAEEGTGGAGSSPVRWVVDPLDGTTNYLYDFPAYAVSIAAEVDGVLTAGVVHDVSRGETFSALRGEGAWRDGSRVSPSAKGDLSTALVGTGFAYLPERRARQAAVLAQVLPLVRDVRRAGSAALDLCWVACGRLDAFYEKGLGPWDLAAGSLVATEAGAVVGDLDGGPPSPDFVLASSPPIFVPLRTLLAGAGAGAA